MNVSACRLLTTNIIVRVTFRSGGFHIHVTCIHAILSSRFNICLLWNPNSILSSSARNTLVDTSREISLLKFEM